MNPKNRSLNTTLFSILSILVLSSCAAPGGKYSGDIAGDTAASAPEQVELAKQAENVADLGAEAEVPKAQPLLRKQARMSLVVESMEDSLKAISDLARKRQGDVLRLEAEQPRRVGSRQTAYVTMRVPARRLEATLDDLAELGIVESRLITAEDVADQLFDFEARLKNLRRSEESVLKILDRSGSVGDVLKVSQELSQIRQQIEQIEAQEKRLRGQVAYSTINIDLESTAVIVKTELPQRPAGSVVQETWSQSTKAVRNLTLSLVSLGIWLLTFSPYLLAIAAAIYGYKKLRPKKAKPVKALPTQTAPDDSKSEPPPSE